EAAAGSTVTALQVAIRREAFNDHYGDAPGSERLQPTGSEATRAANKANRTDASTPARLRPSNPSTFGKARKSMTNSTNTTRRGFFSTAAALAASAAVAIPAKAFGADPIFEAIEAHKAARLAFENAVSRSFALEEELP